MKNKDDKITETLLEIHIEVKPFLRIEKED
jgi:hypothetical protein